MKYKTIDLCAGIGGIRRGFELTGCFENVLSAEIDEFAARTYEHLYGDNPLNDLTSEDFKNKVVNTEYDVLLAGFPCQSFSSVGKKLGFRDSTRGTIFFDIADIISRTNPKAIFLENVENLISHDKGKTIEKIVEVLEDELQYRIIGVTLDEDGAYCYSSKSFVRNTKFFGLPQNRPRAYIMAFSKSHYGEVIKELTADLPFKSGKTIFKDVESILESNVDIKYYLASGYLETLKRHKQRQSAKGYGFGYCVVNQSLDGKPSCASTILATGGSGKERNLIYQPVDGYEGQIVKGKKTPINSEGIRMMTPTEWGRLQGFIGYAFLDEGGNETFSFPEGITNGQKYKQFGNSVSIPVIEEMAWFMLDCFELLEKHQHEIVETMALNRDYFTKRDVMEILNIKSWQAGNLLRDMVEQGDLIRLSNGKATRYIKKGKESSQPPYSHAEKIVDYLKSRETASNKEIALAVGGTANSINVLLCKLVQEERIVRVRTGVYAINE